MTEVQIVSADEGRAFRDFLEFPYCLYRDDPNWVPPLRISQKELFNRRKHPFHAHAEVACFLARSDGRVLGRIAAIHDRNHNDYHQESAGHFGFFECVNDQDAANALLGAARNWLAARGLGRVIRGPFNPSINYECGLLVEGFDSPPRVMMAYNPRYYGSLLEGAGLRKAKDLYSYGGPVDAVLEGKVARIAERAEKVRGLKIRPVRLKAFEEEVEALWGIYNAAWEKNWGYTPMTRDEFLFISREMKPFLDPGFALIGEVDSRVVGFALALPNVNQALKKANGRLLPFGLLKILYHRRSIREVRVIALGVLRRYQTAGVAAGLYASLIRHARERGYRACEMSWVLEDNILMNRSIEELGVQREKTYRIYEWNS